MAGLIEGGRVRATVYKTCPVRDRREEESTQEPSGWGHKRDCVPAPPHFPVPWRREERQETKR